jgi:hypothetical protein
MAISGPATPAMPVNPLSQGKPRQRNSLGIVAGRMAGTSAETFAAEMLANAEIWA